MTIFIEIDDGRHFPATFDKPILWMLWIILLAVSLIVLFGILLAPVEFKMDTRRPVVTIGWTGVGKALLIYEEEEWLIKIRLPFFHKQWSLMQLIFSEKERKKVKTAQIKKRKKRKRLSLSKVLNILKTFRVVKLEVAISSGDYTTNARLYFLNFLPHIRQHVHVNFADENYLVLIIRNNAWRMAYALIK